MRAENLPALDSYIQEHIGTVTTRHASEERYECPPIADAVEAERAMRTTLHVMFDGHVAVNEESVESLVDPSDDLDELKSSYWKNAQRADAAHGARPDFALDDYFHVSRDRSYSTIRASVHEEHGPESAPAHMFGAIDAYKTELGMDVVSSSRLLTSLFGASLPSIKKASAEHEAEGIDPAAASSRAIIEFTASTVPEHIADLKARADAGQDVKRLINKISLYPQSADQEYADQSLRVSPDDAAGIAKAYRVQERPYTNGELLMGESLIRTPAMQRAILLFHQGMVDFAAAYLRCHPERAKHSLEPFTEIFLAEQQEDTENLILIPNPKLIKVIGNNTVPAISRILIEEGASLEDLTGNHVQLGIELAKKLRVFQTQIGQFNNYDPTTGTVDLMSMFNRTCPAMQMFSELLTKHLPDLYDSSRAA